MTCADYQDQFLLLAAGQLEPAEAEALHTHLAGGCTTCAGVWSEAQAVFASVGASLPPVVVVPAAAREKLLSRVAVNQQSRDHVAGRIGTLFRMGVAAAVAAGVAIVVTHHLVSQRIRGEQSVLVAERDSRIDSLLTEVVRLQHRQQISLALLEGPSLKLLQLAGAVQPQASAQLLLNTQTRQWALLAKNLTPLPAQRTYEFWYITPAGQKVRAGTFSGDPSGSAVLEAQIPPEVSAVSLTAVTDEPTGGSDQPTGTIQLVGKIN